MVSEVATDAKMIAKCVLILVVVEDGLRDSSEA